MLARSASSCFASVPRQVHGCEACLHIPFSAADACACRASCIRSDYQLLVAGCLTGLTALESLALRNFYLVGEELQPHILDHLNDPNLGPPPSVSRLLPAVYAAWCMQQSPIAQLGCMVVKQSAAATAPPRAVVSARDPVAAAPGQPARFGLRAGLRAPAPPHAPAPRHGRVPAAHRAGPAGGGAA
jgi:hypothetical protein